MWTLFGDEQIQQKISACGMEEVGRYKCGDESVGAAEPRETRC